MILLKALQTKYLKGQAKEQELNPSTGVTFAGSLELVMKVLELEAQNPESEIQPLFKEIYNHFLIDVDLDNMNGIDENGDAVNGFSNMNGCFLHNIKSVLEKLSVIVKNIQHSMFVGGEHLATVE